MPQRVLPIPSARCIRLSIGVALAFSVAPGCQRDDPPAIETFSPPRPANQGPRIDSLAATAILTENSLAKFSLKAKKNNPQGSVAVSGSLTVDLVHLEHTRGAVRADFETLQFERSAEPAPREESYETRARLWLGLIPSLPTSQREQRRYARFELEGLEELSATNAYQGRVVKRGQPRQDEPAPAGPSATEPQGSANTAPTATASTQEVIEVKAVAHGQLQIGAFRTTHRVPLVLRFVFPFESKPGDQPETIEIRSQSPLRLGLDTYDIRPRDAQGHLVADQLKLLGVEIGRAARVDIELEAIVRGAETSTH